MQYMHGNIPCLFDFWPNMVVHLLLKALWLIQLVSLLKPSFIPDAKIATNSLLISFFTYKQESRAGTFSTLEQESGQKTLWSANHFFRQKMQQIFRKTRTKHSTRLATRPKINRRRRMRMTRTKNPRPYSIQTMQGWWYVNDRLWPIV